MSTHDELVKTFRGAMTAIRPASEMAQARAVSAAIDQSGHIKASAIPPSFLWQPRDFLYYGAVTTGSNVSPPARNRQPMRLVYLDAVCRVGPSGGPLRATVGGVQVAIAAGQTSGTAAANATVAPGALLTLDIAEANGTTDLRVTAWLVPDD